MQDKQTKLTHQHLRSILHYNRKSGIFTWIGGNLYRRVSGEAGAKNKNGYRYIGICLNGKRFGFLAHRLAWFYAHGKWPVDCIDHINGNPSDNRLGNLREASRAQNSQSKKISNKSVSGYRGVNRCSKGTKWRARVQIQLGVFDAPEAAARAVDRVLKRNFGRFAKLNFPRRRGHAAKT